MADYIKTSILFESYVHIDAHFEEESDATEATKKAINNYISDRAVHFLGDKIQTEIKFKAGSLKAYATVRGSLKDALGTYESFSQEITRLFWFSKRISDATVMEVAFQTHSFLGAIERTEARPGIVGKTKRLTDSITSIHNADNEKGAAIMVRRLRLIKNDTKNLLSSLAIYEDKTLIKNEFSELLKSVPKKLTHSKVSDETKEKYLYEYDLVKKVLTE
ncbi:hypothetical protein [Methylophilus sp. Q8]|uniref:hypothetical protein n=1 Tax=Methylophilus sp. Q8 TaxID=1506586 RepID=UPI0006463EE6|nr:hypothetical protein [Methylophilus sp. Q8]